MTKKEFFDYELDVAYESNFPERFYDSSYLMSKYTMAFVGFINTLITEWCAILEKYGHYDTQYLVRILQLDPLKAEKLFGEYIDETGREIGKWYVEVVRKLIVGTYVSGEMLKAEDSTIIYNIHRKCT